MVPHNRWKKEPELRFESAVPDGVLGPSRLARYTWPSPCISKVPKATAGMIKGPWRTPCQKALQGFETQTRELLGGTKEKNVSLTRGHWFASRQIRDLFYLSWPSQYLIAYNLPDVVEIYEVPTIELALPSCDLEAKIGMSLNKSANSIPPVLKLCRLSIRALSLSEAISLWHGKLNLRGLESQPRSWLGCSTVSN